MCCITVLFSSFLHHHAQLLVASLNMSNTNNGCENMRLLYIYIYICSYTSLSIYIYIYVCVVALLCCSAPFWLSAIVQLLFGYPLCFSVLFYVY